MLPAEAWVAISAVIAAVFVYLGTRYTADQSQKAHQESKAQEKTAVDAAAYERARESYEAAIKQYLMEIDRLQARVDVANTRISVLNEEIQRLEESKIEQRHDIEATVEQLVEQRNEHEAHLARCQDRLNRLRRRLEAHEPISEEDPDLLLDA